MDLRDYIEQDMELDKKKLGFYRKKYNSIKLNGKLIRRLNKNAKTARYYYRHSNGVEKYLGKKSVKTIEALQQKRLAKEMIEIIRQNLKLKEWFCESLISDDIEDVLAKLPKAYKPDPQINERRYDRKNQGNGKGAVVDAGEKFPQSENPFRGESLTVRTSFGLYVRSKGEAQIAELLYSLGIEFYYEKALVLEYIGENGYDCKTYYPDFTIILPDGSEIFWEHKGMISQREYVARDIEKEMIYNVNEIYQPHNYMVTCDGPDNNVDMESIKLLVQGWLLPRMAMGVGGYHR